MANLYKRTNGSLVIANSPPPGGTLVTFNVADPLNINAPFYRGLDSSSPGQFHPAIYSSASETNLLDRPLQAKLDLINSQLASVSANISDTYSRVVTDASQTVQRVASLESSFANTTGSTNATISNLQTTVTNGDNANATAISNLTTTVSNNYSTLNSTITNEATSRTTADTALATKIDLLTASYGDVAAKVEDTTSVVTSLTNALAGKTTALETTLNGYTSKITQTMQSVDGIKANYGVTINNNGAISGFALNSDLAANGRTPTTAFIIAADKFAIVDPGTNVIGMTTIPAANSPFQIVGGTTYIKSANIQDLSIGTNHMGINAMNTNFIDVNTGTSIIGVNVGATVNTLVIPIPATPRAFLNSNVISSLTVIGSGANATLDCTTATAHGLVVGDYVGITGVTNYATDSTVGGWNKSYKVTQVISATRFICPIDALEATYLTTPAHITATSYAKKLPKLPTSILVNGTLLSQTSTVTANAYLTIKIKIYLGSQYLTPIDSYTTFVKVATGTSAIESFSCAAAYYPPLEQSYTVVVMVALTGTISGNPATLTSCLNLQDNYK